MLIGDLWLYVNFHHDFWSTRIWNWQSLKSLIARPAQHHKALFNEGNDHCGIIEKKKKKLPNASITKTNLVVSRVFSLLLIQRPCRTSAYILHLTYPVFFSVFYFSHPHIIAVNIHMHTADRVRIFHICPWDISRLSLGKPEMNENWGSAAAGASRARWDLWDPQSLSIFSIFFFS